MHSFIADHFDSSNLLVAGQNTSSSSKPYPSHCAASTSPSPEILHWLRQRDIIAQVQALAHRGLYSFLQPGPICFTCIDLAAYTFTLSHVYVTIGITRTRAGSELLSCVISNVEHSFKLKGSLPTSCLHPVCRCSSLSWREGKRSTSSAVHT